MREDLNEILEFIGAESLTDEEFGSISLDDPEDPIAVYESLLAVVESRELVSNMTSRLRFYFLAQGIEVSEPNIARSNIFVGASLE